MTRGLAQLLFAVFAFAATAADTRLFSNEVARVISQAIARAQQMEPNAVIAVVDREGFVLGVWSDQRHTQLQAEIEEEVLVAAREAERHGTLHSGPQPSAADMFRDVYREMPRHLREQRQEMGV